MRKYVQQQKTNNLETKSLAFDLKNEKEIEWINLLSKYPSFAITLLRKEAPALYAWHYRNNKDWLEEHSSKIVVKATSNNRVDWEKRDLEVLV